MTPPTSRRSSDQPEPYRHVPEHLSGAGLRRPTVKPHPLVSKISLSEVLRAWPGFSTIVSMGSARSWGRW